MKLKLDIMKNGDDYILRKTEVRVSQNKRNRYRAKPSYLGQWVSIRQKAVSIKYWQNSNQQITSKMSPSACI